MIKSPTGFLRAPSTLPGLGLPEAQAVVLGFWYSEICHYFYNKLFFVVKENYVREKTKQRITIICRSKELGYTSERTFQTTQLHSSRGKTFPMSENISSFMFPVNRGKGALLSRTQQLAQTYHEPTTSLNPWTKLMNSCPQSDASQEIQPPFSSSLLLITYSGGLTSGRLQCVTVSYIVLR